DDFLVKIPHRTTNWNQNHKSPESNKNIRLEFNELETILGFLKINNFKYYLIFRIFADTGMRKGELVNIDYNKVNTKKRIIDTHGKKGRKIYYITKELADYLEVYINSRKKNTCKTKALFLTKSYNRYAKRQFNYYLKSVIEKLEIEKNITCKTFRSTLNTLRKVMGCPNEDRKILINHQTDDVNVNHYLKLKYDEFISLFDRWYPYQKINL
ncbi:MAG: tyrosine-type recombinase/integrase, partial [Candidatus Helarchaeota archaeon]